MAKSKKKKDEEVKVVDEVTIEEVVAEEPVVEEVVAEPSRKVTSLTQRTVTFSDGKTQRITSRKEHKKFLNSRK